MPVDMLNLFTQGAMAAVFFMLYWQTNKRLLDQEDKHDKAMRELYALRINDLKIIAKLPTDLVGSMPANGAA